MQYGAVEEFVTSACEAVPGLLTVRHQGKLALGLRARVSLITGEEKSDLDVLFSSLIFVSECVVFFFATCSITLIFFYWCFFWLVLMCIHNAWFIVLRFLYS